MSLKWPAHKASERIARNNAVKIAAAFVAGIDAKKVVEDFMSIHPQVTDNAVQDRVRARAWAIVHVRYNSKPMEAAIRRTYADGWVTGDKAAKQLVDSLIKKADDWSSWTPGSEALAQMVAPKGALAGLLENAGVVSNQLWATKLDEVGTILANGLRDGSTVDTIATNLEEVAGGESKAMVIARTELNRAMTQAAVSRYQDSGIDQVEWEAADPDDECADNDGEVVTYGEEFPSGDIEPPVHPNCRCGLLPVIAEAQTDDGGEDLTDDTTPDETDTADETPDVVETPDYGTTQVFDGVPLNDIIDSSTKAYDYYETNFENTAANPYEDNLLKALYVLKGFDALPEVLDDASFDEKIKGGDTLVYRGLSNTDKVFASQMADEFKTGDYFAGRGLYGNGTYASDKSGTAFLYTDRDRANILDIAVPQDYKFIQYMDLNTDFRPNGWFNFQDVFKKEKTRYYDSLMAAKARGELTEAEVEAKFKPWLDAETMTSDAGRYAALMGYDGIVQDRFYEAGIEEKYYVLLNRGKSGVRK